MGRKGWWGALALVIAGLLAGPAEAACRIADNQGGEARGNADLLARLFAAEAACPKDVLELRALLKRAGVSLQTTLVANRGFHNPGLGSFSLFEIGSGGPAAAGAAPLERGDFFFGHFTTPGPGGKLVLDQTPGGPGSLMVELIAWDEPKGLFNFYELIGSAQQRRWFYRGDSGDVLADTAGLHRASGPQFGARLRCSGCHVAGGPILKELAAPHNDWWRVGRPVGFGGRTPDAELGALVAGLVDADELAAAVAAGSRKLAGSARFRKLSDGRTRQERLRPLFCPVQLNLASDVEPLDEGPAAVQVPAAFFVDERLAGGAVNVSREHYRQALGTASARFPEIARPDGDHGWLTPVKAASDQAAVAALVEDKLVDDEFVADVLAVDLTSPLFSDRRCGLLKLVPEGDAATWRAGFEAALRKSPQPGAADLLANLTDAARDRAAHQRRAAAVLEACRARLVAAPAVSDAFRLLAVRRAEAFASPISSNPRGQILEPGFRVIFPEVRPEAEPGSLRLTEACEVVSAR